LLTVFAGLSLDDALSFLCAAPQLPIGTHQPTVPATSPATKARHEVMSAQALTPFRRSRPEQT
jgi:hypothetical protein